MPTTTIKKVTVNGTVHDIEDSVARAGMLPQEASAGDAMVYNGTEWSKQSGYGYCGEEINSLTWDGSTTGLESVTVTFDFATLTWYKIYPDFIPSNKLVGGTLNYIEEGQPQSYTIQEGYIGPCDQGVDLGYYIGDELLFISAKETVTFNLDQPLQITKGTWFVQAVGDYNYRAASATFSSPVSSVTQIDSKYIPFISNNYVVNFSWNSPYTADKAYSEILSAYNSGKNIIGKTSASGVDIFYNMFLFMENTFAFTADIRSLEMGSIVYSINLRDKVQKQTFAAFTNADKTKLDGIATAATATSVSTTGTSTDEVQYITINGVEKKLAGGGLPDGTAASQGLVWDGTQWVKQAGYAYGTSGSQVTITWDGDTTGRESFADAYYKVSDNVITSAQFLASTFVVNGTTCTISEVDENEGMLIPTPVGSDLGPIVLTVPMENLTAGIYFCKMDSTNFVSSMTYAGAGELHTFDPQLLPLDSTPTSESANGVTSGGVYTALNDKEDIEFNAAPTALIESLSNIVVGGKTYTAGAMPSGTAAGQGLVWNGTEWQKQEGYGYDNASFDESWDGDVTGKTVIFTNYAKISDTVPVTSVGDSLVCYATNSVGETRGPYTCTVSQLATNILRVVYNPGSGSVDVIMAMADTTYGGQPVSKGTYFYFKEDNSYWNSRLIKAGTVQFDSRFIPTPSKINYTTTAPTSVNYSGLKIAYLTSEPATKYDGWLYLIKK